MKLLNYLKDKVITIILYIILLLAVIIILRAINCNLYIMLYIIFLMVLVLVIALAYDYNKRKKFYDSLFSLLKNMDNKSLIHEMINEPNFLEAEFLYQTLYTTDKYKIEEINEYKFREQEFQEFIEMWVHEIKTPLASTSLIVENNPTEVNEDIKNELMKINDYIEQILFYSRSSMVEKDYLIKSISLENVINKFLLKHKKDFLLKKINLEINKIDIKVNTDTKWLEFIVDQIINNSIKYSKDKPQIKIFTKTNKEGITLHICDNGIGISSNDLPRIFDKGFTGENGRKEYNSTGMGLYLVKKLCDKIDHNIYITSKEGSEVMITFPINSFVNEVN